MNTHRPALLISLLVLATACSNPPAPPAPQTAAVDSAALRARADSMAAAARRDSLRADSIARARADSIAMAARNARADSIRAQVARDSAAAAMATASGLSRADDAVLSTMIHFEFNRADLTSDAQRALDAKIALLRANPRLEIQIAGHCDERGPDEYNLALGNRRAASAKRYLVSHGIAAGRISIISYGEERPLDPGHTEDAWAKNRRDEFSATRSAR